MPRLEVHFNWTDCPKFVHILIYLGVLEANTPWVYAQINPETENIFILAQLTSTDIEIFRKLHQAV